MDFKSYTKKEVREALEKGEKIFALNTDSGEDDILIGDYETALMTTLEFFGWEALPDQWELEECTDYIHGYL